MRRPNRELSPSPPRRLLEDSVPVPRRPRPQTMIQAVVTKPPELLEDQNNIHSGSQSTETSVPGHLLPSLGESAAVSVPPEAPIPPQDADLVTDSDLSLYGRRRKPSEKARAAGTWNITAGKPGVTRRNKRGASTAEVPPDREDGATVPPTGIPVTEADLVIGTIDARQNKRTRIVVEEEEEDDL